MRDLLALIGVFIRRDLTIARSYRFPFVIELITSAGILLVVHQISGLVDPARSSDANLRAGFFPYVLVGIAVLQFVHTALVSFTSKLREEQVTGTFEALLTTSASPPGLALSLAAYPMVQGVVSALVLLAAGLGFGAHYDVSATGLLSSVVCGLALAALAAGVGVGVAAFTVVFKRGGTVAALVSTAVALLAGVYFPVAQLPIALRWVGEALPFTWGITALRASLFFGDVDIVRIGGLIVAVLVVLPCSLLLFRRAVDHARRRGSLGQY